MIPKKILFLHHGGGASGADISLLYLMRGLKNRGITCVVACVKDRGGAVPFYASHGFKAFGCRADFFPHCTGRWYPLWKPSGLHWFLRWTSQYKSACRRILQAIKNESPDIVHLNSLTLAPYLSAISSTNIPAVLHVRERVHAGSFGIRKRWLKKTVPLHASAVVYICKDNRDFLTGDNPVGQVVYNPVDFSEFDKNLMSEGIRRRIDLSTETNLILFLGGSDLLIKGIMPLLKSLQILKEQIRDFKCVMLGTNSTFSSSFFPTLKRKTGNYLGIYSLRQQIENCIVKYDIANHVITLPFTRHVEDYYAIADVVVVPFIEPHFARQIIEAGAMAKPVVGSRLGGIEEVVIDGETGILVEPGDPKALAKGLALILGNPEVSRRMGEAAYLIAAREYDLDVHVNRVIDIYQSIL